MNRQHFTAILWLRWRLSVNQWRRAGTVNLVLMVIVVTLALTTAVSAFFVSLIGGLLLLPEAGPDQLMLIWDAMVGGLLVFWIFGLVIELQRPDAVSLEKLLHLPLSLTGAFLLNYLSSLVSLTLAVFLPLFVGLAIALVIVQGPPMLISFPLMLGFVLMLTAVTYQFRSWLALLMQNKRRRRALVAFFTAAIILVAQLPNLLNLMVWQPHRDRTQQQRQAQQRELQESLKEGEISSEEFTQRSAALKQQQQEQRKSKERQLFQRVVKTTTVINVVLPIGWLPYGIRAAALGNFLPGMLGMLGAALIGTASLWRSYRTTIRLYTGDYGSPSKQRSARSASRPTRREQSLPKNLIEKQLPGVSEHATGVALASFRSLTRAPEAKMMLLMPIIMLGVFGSMILAGSGEKMPVEMHPFLALGAIGLALFGFVQFSFNTFGFDRNGFRVYVLSPVPRKDVLVGKNLATAPLILSICVLTFTVLQFILPLTIAHFLATLVQTVLIYLLFCLVGNLASILAPFAIKSDSLNPAKPTITAVFIQFGSILLLPLALLPAAIPLGIELLLDVGGRLGGMPVYLVLSILELAGGLWVYRWIVALQGNLLQRHEQRILAAVIRPNE